MYLKNLVSSCQLPRLVGDAVGRFIPNDVESLALTLRMTQLRCTLDIQFNTSTALWGKVIALNSKGWMAGGRWQVVKVNKTYFQS